METRPHSSFHVSAFPLSPSNKQPQSSCSHAQSCADNLALGRQMSGRFTPWRAALTWRNCCLRDPLWTSDQNHPVQHMNDLCGGATINPEEGKQSIPLIEEVSTPQAGVEEKRG
ncbi:uncharacterized protein ACIQIH_015129 isoform 1-T1 [Cyanocitta cristata]